MKIRDRIVELRRVRGRDLLPNPANWRTHPTAQLDALRGVLAEVGFADAALAFETPEGLMLFDGHARASIAPDSDVPVLVTDLTADEARKMLAVLDPLAALAGRDDEALGALLDGIETESDAVRRLLDGLAGDDGPEGGDAPEQNLDPGDDRYQEQYGVIVVCPDEAAQKRTYDALVGQGYECKVVVT